MIQISAITLPDCLAKCLRQALLYFDRFHVYRLRNVLDGDASLWGQDTVSAVRRLTDLGVFQAVPDLSHWELESTLMDEARDLVAQEDAQRKVVLSSLIFVKDNLDNLDLSEEPRGTSDPGKLREKLLQEMESSYTKLVDMSTSSHMLMRIAAIELERRFPNEHTVPFLPTYPQLENAQYCRKQEVLGVVLRALPEPDESVPLEAILEFRADPEARNRFLALRNWQSEMASSNLNAKEIAESLEYQLTQYQDYMKAQKMKFRTGVLETVLVTTTEVLESLVTFRWSKAIERLFNLRRREIQLYESERQAPGREVAYIAKAHDLLDGSDSDGLG